MPKTALHHAAANGFLPAVTKLLKEGHSTGCWDKDGWTPLHHACRNNHVDVAAELIRAGADVNAQNKRKVSPLHESAYRGYLELVKILLAAGAFINATDKDGWTPLHAACRQENVDVAGKLPRDYAVDQGSTVVIGILDQHADEKGIVYAEPGIKQTPTPTFPAAHQQHGRSLHAPHQQNQLGGTANMWPGTISTTSLSSSPKPLESDANETEWHPRVGQLTKMTPSATVGDAPADNRLATGGKKRRSRGRGKRNSRKEETHGRGMMLNGKKSFDARDYRGAGGSSLGEDELLQNRTPRIPEGNIGQLNAQASAFQPSHTQCQQMPAMRVGDATPAGNDSDAVAGSLLSRLNAWTVAGDAAAPASHLDPWSSVNIGSLSTGVQSSVVGAERITLNTDTGQPSVCGPAMTDPKTTGHHQSLFEVQPTPICLSSSWVPDLPLPPQSALHPTANIATNREADDGDLGRMGKQLGPCGTPMFE